MAIINVDHSLNLPGGYYTEQHHIDPTTVTDAELTAAKAERFYFELSADPGSGQIIGMGSMSFTDGGTVESNATVQSEYNTYSGQYSFDPSAGHLEVLGFNGAGDNGLTVTSSQGVNNNQSNLLEVDGVTYTEFGYINLVGIVLDGNQGTGTKAASLVGYYVPVYESNGTAHHLFFPTGDQDLSAVTMPDGSGSVSTITHYDNLADSQGNAQTSYLSYMDLMSYNDAVAPVSSTDKIVTGTSGDDVIDVTYTGDGDGDLVDNDDGNPTSADGNDYSIVAGDGNDTINGGDGADTMLGEGGDDVFKLTGSNPGNDSIVGGETGETGGDCIDMSGMTQGVNIDMSAGTGESGTISYGDVSSVTLASNGGTYFDPTNLFSLASQTYPGSGTYEPSNPGPDGTLDHIQIDGKDYIIHTGSASTEIWLMDPDTGLLTLDQDIVRTSEFHAGAGVSAPSTDPTDPATASWLNALGIPIPTNYIVEGTAGGDLINGSYDGDPEGDFIDNNDGNPVNPGAAGGDNDSVLGFEGDDMIYSGAGDDTVYGGQGNDSILGGTGNDTLYGESGIETTTETFESSLNGWTISHPTLSYSSTEGVDGSGAASLDDTASGQNYLRAPTEFIQSAFGSQDPLTT